MWHTQTHLQHAQQGPVHVLVLHLVRRRHHRVARRPPAIGSRCYVGLARCLILTPSSTTKTLAPCTVWTYRHNSLNSLFCKICFSYGLMPHTRWLTPWGLSHTHGTLFRVLVFLPAFTQTSYTIHHALNLGALNLSSFRSPIFSFYFILIQTLATSPIGRIKMAMQRQRQCKLWRKLPRLCVSKKKKKRALEALLRLNRGSLFRLC